MGLIGGPSGSGARVVARALATEIAAARGGDCIFGVCTLDANHPHRAIAHALDTYLSGDSRQKDARRERVAQSLRSRVGDRNQGPTSTGIGPLLAPLSVQLQRLGGQLPTGPQLAAPEEQVTAAIVELLIRLAEYQPLVLLLEDLHWLDSRGLALFHHLRNNLEGSQLLVLCTATTGTGQEAIERIFAPPSVGESACSCVSEVLPALSHTASRAMLCAALGSHDLDDAVVTGIRCRSANQPEAVIECIYTLLDRGALRPSWGSWILDHERLERIAIPHALEELLAMRIDGLTPTVREVLEWAALLGMSFELDHLTTVCGQSPSGVTRAIEAGLRIGVIERVTNQLYRHVHPRVRQQILGELSEAKKRAGHRAIAEAFDAVATPTVDEMLARAKHYRLSLSPETARRTDETNRIAGAWAARTGAAESAYQHLLAASEARACGKLPKDAGLAAELGEMCLRTGRLSEASSCVSTLLAETTDPVVRASYRAKMAAIHRAELEFDAAWNELTQGFDELGIRSLDARAQRGTVLAGRALARFSLPKRRLDDAGRQRAEVLTTLCEHAAITACYDLRPRDTERCLLLPQYALSRLGATPEVVGIETTAAIAFASFGQGDLAQTQLERACAHAETLGHPVLLARCAAARAAVLAYRGEPLLAEAAHEFVLHDHGLWLDAVDYARSCMIHAWGLWLRGHCVQAGALLQQGPRGPAGRPGIQPQARFWAALGYWTASVCEATLGNRPASRGLTKRAQALTQGRSVGHFHRAYALMIEMLTGLDGTEPPGAEQRRGWESRWEALDLKVEQIPTLLRPLWLARAWLAARGLSGFTNQSPPQAALDQFAQRVAELDHVAHDHPIIGAHTHVLRAVIARLQGNYTGAIEHLSEAQTSAHLGDSPWALFECTCERARVLRGMGLHEASRREARQAQELATEFGWNPRRRRVHVEFHLSDGAPLGPRSSTSARPPGQLSRYLDALLAVSRVAVTNDDPDTQARQILDELVAVLGAERALLFTFDDINQEPSYWAGRSLEGRDLPPQDNISQTVLEHVAATREIKLVSGNEDGEVLSTDSVIAHHLKSIVAAPLVVGDRLMGVVYLDNHLVRGLFSSDDLLVLGAMCNHVAIALESARMSRFMQNARDQALEAARLRSAFLTHMSHELRTPLNAILGYAEMVKEDVAKQAPDTVPDIDRISESGRHLLGIIADILELSKLESGNATFSGSEIDVSELIYAVADPYHASCFQAGNQFKVYCPRTLGTVFTDPEKLQRVLQHLLDNAVKFTEAGEVELRAQWRNHADGRRLAIEVADTGIGMTSEQQTSLFTPFYQGDMSTTRRYGGTGIGMALSKHLVTALGGSLYVESREGKGSCFTVQLPPRLPV